MNRSDYNYLPLSEPQYEQIIAAGTMQGTSPVAGAANWSSMDAAAKARNADPRVLLAALQMEDHFGTDPAGGVVLAKVFNFGGIKWPGAPGPAGWYDSGIPCPPNEGGTYAGFRDFGSFILALCDTLNNEYCGPSFREGDLAGAWAVYVGGPNNPNHVAGQSRVDQWQYFLAHYPPQGGIPVTDNGIYGEDIIAVLIPHLGENSSDGSLDPWNGAHPWPGYCEASMEGAQYAAGIADVVHRGSAALKGDAVVAQGLLQTSWPPEDGGICLWGRNFDPQGHTAAWSAAKQAWISTLYPPHAGLDYFYSDAWKNAMMGWYRAPGVVAANRAAPLPQPKPAVSVFFADGNPHGPIPMRDLFWARFDALNTMGTKLDHPGAINPSGLALPVLGYPMEPERTLQTGRRVQRFERAWLATQGNVAPFDVVALLLTEQPQ